MNILIVYDSIFGHTATLAKAIGDVLVADHHRVTVHHVQEIGRTPITAGHDLLIVGSPTRGHLPTPAMREFAASLGRPPAGTSAAAFDTRLDLSRLKPPLRWAVDIGGYAASRLSRQLRERGYIMKGEEGAFVVTGLKGPLRDGELDRARAWAQRVASTQIDTDAEGIPPVLISVKDRSGSGD